MLQGEIEEVLLEKARFEEKSYNWTEVARLYEQVMQVYLDKKVVEKAAECYKKIGYAYSRAANKSDSAEEYLKLNKNVVKAYKKAVDIYKEIDKSVEVLECEAEALYFNGIIEDSLIGAYNSFRKSYELFIKASEIYSKKSDQESFARTLSRAITSLSLFSSTFYEHGYFKQLFQEGKDLSIKSWNASMQIKNTQYIAETLRANFLFLGNLTFVIDFKWDEKFKEWCNEALLRCDKSLMLIEESDDYGFLGIIYSTVGSFYGFYGVQLIENEIKQRQNINKGLKLLEKGLEYARKAEDKQIILWSVFWLDWWAWLGGRVDYLQKRIFDDLQIYEKISKIYKNLCNPFNWMATIFPAIYYTNFAQRSFFTSAQRKRYAEKGIKYANTCIKISPLSPWSALAYQMLTWIYSQLTTLAKEKDERDKNAQKMLEYAKKAEEIAENYEGGLARSAQYSSMFRAYKTLADNAENKEDRIKMLSVAIEASKKYIEHAMESRTGIITAQMRLGLLYEELGILTVETDPLMQARESFLNVIKESLEKGYYSYAAVTHEYIAHIEDRLGNHSASAKHYEKAQESHTKSLKNIEYEPLKDRVKDQINYTRAWNLIEQAKTHHKRENHLKAKECYENSCEILKELPSYNYEALYYTAWITQEEAEQLSKQEKHKEAIESYEKTKNIFNDAMKMLIKSADQSKDKNERGRIKKLEKVAEIRMNHCSARADLEKARILGKQGEHLAAAEKFSSAASQFRDICTFFKIKREREELEAVYYLCKAWESMELAEKYEDPDRFAEAANLFSKASKLFTESKLKLLASGNSAFCQAMEHGCKFDESIEMQIKAQLYPKIKLILRKAAILYGKGGFESGADWALATSAYFDAAWHLIRADEELELDKRRELLGIGSKYLRSAAELFSKTGYKDKEKEVQERLERLEKEEKILFSALSTIREPSISRSTLGIVAPACPIETSQSPRISEARQINEESRRVMEEMVAKKKYNLIYRDLLKEYPKIQRRECRVGIAQIGLSNTGDILSEFYEENTLGLLGLREDKVENVRNLVKNMIEMANTKGVNILLFPEMTIDLNYGEFLEDISNLARVYEMYIIPGSYHDQEIKRNLSVVIGPDGILWEQEKHIPAIIHLEGKRFKEGIDVGDIPRKTIICNTEYGRIAIIICRDFLDMDLRVELKNFEPPVDIILNPAFTPVTADFKAAHFDARRSIYAYCFFANVAEFGDSLIYTPEKERIERTIQPKKEDLIYKDIDLFKLRSERKKWEKEKSKERRFIQSTRE